MFEILSSFKARHQQCSSSHVKLVLATGTLRTFIFAQMIAFLSYIYIEE